MFLAGQNAMGLPIASFGKDNRQEFQGLEFGPQLFDAPSNPGTLLSISTAGPQFLRGVQVDNDRDGTNESIWMDIGMPMYANQDGKRIKPLVAYHVIDLDSKININVHGNRSQIARNNRFANSVYPDNFFVDPLTMAPGLGTRRGRN